MIIVLMLAGLCLGSFVNAWIWRVHEQSKNTSKKAAKSKDKLSIIYGRSICPNCRHQLVAKDLVPLLSWISLRGRCRYCKKTISFQYPLVEVTTAFLFVFSYVFWPLMLEGRGLAILVLWLMFLVGFVALAVYDLKWMLLPDKIVFPLTYLAAAQCILLFLLSPGIAQTIAIFSSVAIGAGIFYIVFQLSQGKWIGGGDVKLGLLLGLVLADGGLMTFAIFAASVAGTLISLPLIALGKADRHSHIPFGPFLIFGAIIARLFGAAFIAWYKQLLII